MQAQTPAYRRDPYPRPFAAVSNGFLVDSGAFPARSPRPVSQVLVDETKATRYFGIIA
jgi:hypothetical protein